MGTVYQQAMLSFIKFRPPISREKRTKKLNKRLSSWIRGKIETAEGSDLVSSVYLVFIDQ